MDIGWDATSNMIAQKKAADQDVIAEKNLERKQKEGKEKHQKKGGRKGEAEGGDAR